MAPPRGRESAEPTSLSMVPEMGPARTWWKFEETNGVVDVPGSYRRLVVNCGHPGHATEKAAAQCRKRRNFGVRAASASGLGLMEPYAYLGAWLRGAALYFDAASGQSQAF